MNAFFDWLMSSEPCTPAQVVAVCVAVFGAMFADMAGIAWICSRMANGEED